MVHGGGRLREVHREKRSGIIDYTKTAGLDKKTVTYGNDQCVNGAEQFISIHHPTALDLHASFVAKSRNIQTSKWRSPSVLIHLPRNWKNHDQDIDCNFLDFELGS